jgi:hypothetical protein
MGALDWIDQHILGQAPGPPGTAGAAKPGDALIYDPMTGFFRDPNNGQMYVDQNGSQPIGNVNAAQQTGADFGTSRSLLGNLAASQAQQQAGFGGEQQLANSLRATISGGMPSVAQNQLGIGQDALAAQQLSQAAGVSGPSAPLAQLLAMRNTAAGQLGVNQQAGLLRAHEAATAQGQLGNVLGNMAQQGQAGYNSNLAGGQSFASTAANLASGRENTSEDASQKNADREGQRIQMLGQGASAGMAGG